MTQTSKNHNRIFGFGELAVDHLFVGCEVNNALYLESSGGGSVWNALANLSAFGRDSVAAIVGSRDHLGGIAVDSLKSVGVNVHYITRSEHARTRAFFALLEEAPLFPVRSGHKFTDRCFICEQRPSRTWVSPPYASDFPKFQRGDVVCIDNLSAFGLEAAQTAKRIGATTVLDCGHVSPLRYKPIAAILKALCTFDLILVPSRVANSIVRRSGLGDICDLAKMLGSDKSITVSDGSRGATMLSTFGAKLKSQFLEPFLGTVEDAGGAGDRLLAIIVDSFLDVGTSEKLLTAVADRIPRDLTPVLEARGARGHLQNTCHPNELLNSWKGQNVIEIRKSMMGESTCAFCGSLQERQAKTRRMKPQATGIASNIDDLGRRALFAAEKREPLSQCKRILGWKGNAFVVATGGSFAAAVFISNALNRFGQLFCQPIKPLDYVRLSKVSDYLFVVSYSGSTKDCATAISQAHDLKVKTVVLITSKTEPALKELLRPQDVLISYGNGHSRERGFVSVAGTVAPCTLWAAACLGATADITPLAEHFNGKWLESADLSPLKVSLENDQPIDILGGGDSWPAVLDLESKMIEGNLGRATLHEVKDFSHGRFLHTFSAHSARQWLLLRTADSAAYEDALARVLRKNGTVYDIRAVSAGLLGGLELLVKVQYLAFRLGQLLNIDISRPKDIPPDGLRLYKWGDS